MLTINSFLFYILKDISIRLRSDENTTTVVFPSEFYLALDITSYTGVLFSLVGLTLFFLTHLIFKYDFLTVNLRHE